jgi:hypothetical protein
MPLEWGVPKVNIPLVTPLNGNLLWEFEVELKGCLFWEHTTLRSLPYAKSKCLSNEINTIGTHIVRYGY